MVMKVVGLVIALIGLFLNFACTAILNNVLKVTEPTDEQKLSVKIAGLAFAVVGAIIVFIFG